MPHSFRIALSLALYLLRSDPFALRGLLLLLPVLTVPLHLPLGIIRYPRYCFIYPCSRRYPRCYAYPRYKVRTPLTERPCTKGNGLDAIRHPNKRRSSPRPPAVFLSWPAYPPSGQTFGWVCVSPFLLVYHSTIVAHTFVPCVPTLYYLGQHIICASKFPVHCPP